LSQIDLSKNFFIELGVALIVVAAFVAIAALTVKERHRDVAAWHVVLGAAIYGAVFGGVIGFIIVPLRALLIDGSRPPRDAAVGGLAFIAIMVALRSGIIMRLPFLGPQVRAWRRASLRRSIEASTRQLDRLGAPRSPTPKM